MAKEKKMNAFDELKQVKTLLVDDDEFIRNSLELAFKTKGCPLQVAESAEEGDVEGDATEAPAEGGGDGEGGAAPAAE